MKMHRRTLLKGMMAGSAIIAAGLPKLSLARAEAPGPREVVLLACGHVAPSFLAAAGATAGTRRYELGSGPLPDLAAIRALLASCPNARLAGLMEDGAYVLFSELARDAGARLLLEGRHSIAVDGRASRHIIDSAAGFHGAAESLAAALAAANAAFAIVETPIGSHGRALRGGDWSGLGFDSFHVAGETPSWLHLCGVSPRLAAEALGASAEQVEPLRVWPTYTPHPPSGARDWSAVLAATLTRLAAGGHENSRPCVRQAFIHRREALDDFAARDSFVSFVMEA